VLLELETSELLKEGIAAAKAGARSAARARLLQVTQDDPDNATGWVWLASVTESTEEKVSALRRFLKLRPGHSQGLDSFKKALFELGMTRAKGGDKRSARELLNELCELDGRLDQAWFWLASVASNRAEARRCLERVVELRPDHRQALVMLARLDPPKPSQPTPREEAPQPVAVQTAAAWLCPLCRTPSDDARHKCPTCKAILDFEPLSDALENRDVDEKLLRESIIRSKNLTDSDLGFEAQICLALAYLNLKKLDESARHLELACRHHPSDEALKATLNAIRAHTKPAASPTRGTVLAVDDSPTVQS
jgi:Tfp pilus assembly protein PilF